MTDETMFRDRFRILLTARSSSSVVSPRPTPRRPSGASEGAFPHSPAGRLLQRAPSRLISHRSLTSQHSMSSPHAPSSGTNPPPASEDIAAQWSTFAARSMHRRNG